MTMFNITDSKNNISRDKPVEHIDLVTWLGHWPPRVCLHFLHSHDALSTV